MRPIKIAISAFGPYAGKQVIDFRDLDGRNFFLIHGKTGAGKTSLLDAMCFALYGDSSGDERAGRDMRSHHADVSIRTEVVFDFAIGQSLYRVSRSPQQDRPRKKGGGVTLEQAQATLWCRDRAADEDDDGRVLASQPNKVTAEVEKLLNFQSSQFRQVVILPQGQFRRLLMAESVERQQILETLFRTEIYRRIEEALKSASKEIKDRWSEAGTRSEIILKQAGVESHEQLLNLEQSVAAEFEQAQLLVKTARQDLDKSQDRLNAGLQAEKVLSERVAADNAFELLKQQGSDVESKRLRLRSAQEASHLIAAESNLSQRRNELAAARVKLEAAEIALKESIFKKERAQLVLSEEEGRETDREEVRRSIQQVVDLSGKVEEFVKSKAELQAAELQSNQLRRDREKLALEVETCEKSLEERSEQLRQLESSATMLEVNDQIAQTAEKTLQSRCSLDKACQELSSAAVEAERAKAELQRSESEVSSCRVAVEQMERSWLFGQASILAGQLAHGSPCPVCGSADHPDPAKSQGAVPTESDLNAQRNLLSVKESAKVEANERKLAWDSSVTKLQSQVHALTEALGDEAFCDVSLLQKRIRETRAAAINSQQAVSATKVLRPELDALKRQHLLAKEKLMAMEASVEADNTRRFQLAGIVQERESTIPEQLQDITKLRTRQSELTNKLGELEKGLKAAQANANASNQQFASCEADRRNAIELADALSTTVDAVLQEFRAMLDAAGFVDEESYHSSKLSADELTELQNEIKSFDSAIHAADERATRARAAALAVATPDMQAIQAELESAKAVNNEAVRTAAELEVRLKHLRGYIKEFEKSKEDSRALEAEFESFGRISEVANGNNGRKLTFQRYVLGALLDDVLLAASDRLSIMSQGRYRLQRVSGTTDLRKAGGLELEVMDSYTGTTRAAATLSGGESFLASMSLALGLADVVQSYAGGIHLETMFIDEGFGSLDPESLDFAIRALRDLQKSGRLVGIISHVPELQERIDARLEVVPCAQGSIASFKFG